MNKINVTLVLNSMSLSGAPKLALDVFRAARNEVCLRTLSPEFGPRYSDFRDLGHVNVLPQGNLRSRLISPLVTAKVSAALALHRPDLVYVNSVMALPLLNRIRCPKSPVLLHVHEMDSYLTEISRDYSDLLVHLPDRYIAVSDAVKNALVGKGVDPERISVIHAFVRLDDFRNVEMRQHIKPNGPYLVGGSGIPKWHKGVELWLQSAAEVAKRLGENAVRFVWVGVKDDADGWRFREMARKLRVDHIVDFVRLTETPLAEYAKFDVFALSSWEDSCPLVVLENMLLGVPVVCFRGSGGAADEVGETGAAVPEFSPVEMADAIVDLLQSPERRGELGRAAHQRVKDNFTDAIQAPKILDEIRRMLGATR